MKTTALVTLILCYWFFSADAAAGKKVVCVTIPKCGTHLLTKCLSLLSVPGLHAPYSGSDRLKPSPRAWKKFDKINRFDPPNHFTGYLDPRIMGDVPKNMKIRLAESNTIRGIAPLHVPYSKSAEDYIIPRSRASFFVIRDPRAMIVSMAFMVSKGWRDGEVADPGIILLDLIDGRQKNFIRWGATVNGGYPLLWEYGIVGFYKMYLPWMQAKAFYTVRFEDLVGSKGGGSDELQYQEILNIAKHIGVTLSAEKIKEVSDGLFGGSTTFRDGQIDGWKKHFTPEVKEAFKKVPGANQLLIDLGYEKDSSW
jgi:hypothetical protein